MINGEGKPMRGAGVQKQGVISKNTTCSLTLSGVAGKQLNASGLTEKVAPVF